MSDSYVDPLLDFMSPQQPNEWETVPRSPEGRPRITVHPQVPTPVSDEARGMATGLQGGMPVVETGQANLLQPQEPPPRPIQLIPVSHEPDFGDQPQQAQQQPVTLLPVDYDPFAEPKHPHDGLTEEQLHQMAGQVKGGALQTGNPQDVATSAGRGVIQQYQDYLDPWAKNDQGGYVADQPIAGPHGKTPEVTKPSFYPALGGIDLASNLIPGGGAAHTAIWAGPLAAKANLKALARAKQLVSEGIHPELTRQITGWFQGADSKWRFRIPDNASHFAGPDAAVAQQQLAGQRLERIYDELMTIKDPVTEQINNPQRYNELKRQYHEIEQGLQRGVTLGDVLHHPELFENYPHLKNLPVKFEDLGNTHGHYAPPTAGEDLWAGKYPEFIRPGDPGHIALDHEKGNRSVLLHETQHAVQDHEGFARGGNLNSPEVLNETENTTGKRRKELLGHAQAQELRMWDWITEQSGIGIGDKEALKKSGALQRMEERFFKENPEERELFNQLQVDTLQVNEAHRREAHAAYKRLAGEVEARAVQHEMGMGARRLETQPPIDSEDIPRDRQIVVEQRPRGDNQGLQADHGVLEEANHGPGQQEAAPMGQAEAAEKASIRGSGGDFGVAEAQAAAKRAGAGSRPLEGLPQEPITIRAPGGDVSYVPGPIQKVHDVATKYMKDAGLKYQPLETYQPVKESRAKLIAKAFEEMKHDPENPRVRASYDAMIKETVDQLKAVQDSGLKIEFIKPGQADPYEASPRMATMDVRDNNHLWVFPTDSGFGSLTAYGMERAKKRNPLLQDTGIEIDGRKVLANDAFRIVHDYFGHIKDGVGFRAAGEENAWRSHSRMYSPLAREAMTSETRGQNSWLNYGPHGDNNRKAKSADTIYANQKTGLLPRWTHLTGAADPYVAPVDDAGKRIVNAGVDAPTNKKAQTVSDPHRMMYPGIYEDPRKIAKDAAERVAPEDMMMKRLWGVSRGDLDEMAKTRVGNQEPNVYRGPGKAHGALSAQNIQTPANTQRLQDTLEEAGKHPGLKHADAWYILDPVYQRMEQMFGPEEAKTRFEKLNTLMGMASPGSEVTTEIQRGSAAHMKATQGNFDEFLKHAGTPREFRKGPKDLERVEAHPYHRTSQAEPMQKYLDTGSIQSKEPKVPLYVQASGVKETGFQTRGPVPDSHFSRGVGLADTRKGPTDVASSASRSEYHTLQPWWADEVAATMGLEAVPAQARLWTALGPRTGVSSALGQGKLELLTTQIVKAAKRMGVTPEQARDLILSGKAHAGMLAGGGVAGGVMADQLKNYGSESKQEQSQ